MIKDWLTPICFFRSSSETIFLVDLLLHYLDYAVTIHRMHGELTLHYLSVAVIYYKEIVCTPYTEAVDRYPLL